MLLRAIFIAILLYFIIKVVRNLIRAVREEAQPPRPIEPPHRFGSGDPRHPRERSEALHRRTPREEDIEDAKWEDIS